MRKEGLLVRALAMDGHGVVYRRQREVVDSLVEALSNRGLIFSKEEAKRVYLALQERTFAGELSYEEMVAKLHHQLRLGDSITPFELHELIQKFSAEIEIDPALPFVVNTLRARGIQIGMLTNSIHPAAIKETWLRKAGIVFDLIISSVEEGCKKPSTEIYRRFVTRLRLSPEQVAFLGHDAREINGARTAGLVTIALACPQAQADFHIHSLRELLELPIWPTEKEVP